MEPGIEVVFGGADSGEVTIRDNSAAIGPGRSGPNEPQSSAGR
jgi:hypothetical protein